jgi:hypothetical protein
VALLYAGSSTTTIGNRADEVLTQISAALGRAVSFVGSGQASIFDTLASNNPLPQELDRADQARRRHEQELMLQPEVLGVGVGRDDLGDGAIIVYVNQTAGRRPVLPARVDNVRVIGVFTDPFVAR